MGAGAVGCYFGGMLARGGHDVTLIARPQHVEAIDYLNGHVVRRGKALGLRTPANQVLWAMVKLIEAKG